MLAERRDLTVATNSSVFGMDDSSIVCAFTGKACAAGFFALVFAQETLTTMSNAATTADRNNETPLKPSTSSMR